jgi:hypothetical protein
MFHATLLVSLKSSKMGKDAPTWFETLWSYGVKIIDYWSIFSMKFKSNGIGILGVISVFLESPWWVKFNRVYFINFGAKVWKILVFEWIFVVEISNKLQKILGLEGKLSWALNVFTLGPTTQGTLVTMNWWRRTWNGWIRGEMHRWIWTIALNERWKGWQGGVVAIGMEGHLSQNQNKIPMFIAW